MDRLYRNAGKVGPPSSEASPVTRPATISRATYSFHEHVYLQEVNRYRPLQAPRACCRRSVSDYEGLLAQVPESCARERVYRELPGLRRSQLRVGHY